MKKCFLLLFILGLTISIKAQKSTIIYLVRHAEKVTTDPTNKDPLLTEKGQKRALDLAKKIKKKKLFAIYCTDYQRIKLTAYPIAEIQNLTYQIYDPKNLKAFAEKILQDYKGKKVLIVGHSNTVLETIEALGGKRPFTAIADYEYDYFFTLKISVEGLVEMEVGRYGERNDGLIGNETMKAK
jgi:broad specificity phosphatase PhoE